LIEREIIYRILQTPQGERLRAIGTSGSLPQRAAKAITWLSANYTKTARMEELAEIARVGVSTFHHQFRTLTSMSPIQFQKQLRLKMGKRPVLTGSRRLDDEAASGGAVVVNEPIEGGVVQWW
jgi:transcriptional regulator GlxA family with amidase domain